MEKISVIVPVYNSEKYIEQCIRSITEQKYQNLEIILINDGSTDGTPALLERMKAWDKRICVFHKQNGGEGTTRNLGISVATGEYILFVDSDDWIDNNHISTLYDAIKETDSDVAVTNFTPFIEDTGVYQIHITNNDYYQQVFTPQEWFKMQYGKPHHLSQCFTVPWCKLYKKSLFRFVRYPEHVKHAADDYTTWKLYLVADKIVYTNASSYVYRENSASLTQTGSLAEVFLTKPIEERLMLLSMIGFDLEDEIAAMEWRLHISVDEALKKGDVDGYKAKKFLQTVMQKYKKK
ncbi:TPA: glycosyltransferase family 2 protein [Streptococcus agalactiae]